MPDFRVADTAAFDEKLIAAGNSAVGLWVRAGAWSMQQLTDGFIPTRIARQIGTKNAATRLTNCGLWCDVEGGYQFVKWLGYQRSKEQVESERDAARARMKRIRSGERSSEQKADVQPNGSPERSAHVRDSHPFPSHSGYVGEGSNCTAREESPPPGNLDPDNPRCPDHLAIAAVERGPNCRACAAVRKWCENEPERRKAAIREAARIRRACTHCDESGLIETEAGMVRCDHKDIA